MDQLDEPGEVLLTFAGAQVDAEAGAVELGVLEEVASRSWRGWRRRGRSGCSGCARASDRRRRDSRPRSKFLASAAILGGEGAGVEEGDAIDAATGRPVRLPRCSSYPPRAG